MAKAKRLILASGSSARRSLLQSAGLAFDVVPADIDEAAHLAAWTRRSAGDGLRDAALMLAVAKAEDVSRRNSDALVIGGDQILALGEIALHKAANREDAQATLLSLRGRTHDLHASVALAIAGKSIWTHVDTARMNVRNFSEEWLEEYLNSAGSALTACVGAYEFESRGIQLFESVEGSYFTVLGLPILPLLAELRRRGEIAS